MQQLYKLLQMFHKASTQDKVLMLIFLLLLLAVLKR